MRSRSLDSESKRKQRYDALQSHPLSHNMAALKKNEARSHGLREIPKVFRPQRPFDRDECVITPKRAQNKRGWVTRVFVVP